MRSLVFVPFVLAATLQSATAEIGVGREAKCLVIEDGTRFVDGICEFTPSERDGSFHFKTYNGQFWGHLYVVSKGVGEVFWNGEPYASHAHNSQFDLIRNEACWVNERSSFCFW